MIITPGIDKITVIAGVSGQLMDTPGAGFYIVPSIGYLPTTLSHSTYREMAINILTRLKEFAAENTVMHFHNPNLGKNPSLTLAIYELARAGNAMVIHFHDFAEDRPDNIRFLKNVIPSITGTELQKVLYPLTTGCHFIVLNKNDHKRLVDYGIPVDRIHLLHNPVLIRNAGNTKDFSGKQRINRMLGFDSSKRICIYPVRAIKRKNIGEFILIAALYNETMNFAITQPPKNPDETNEYERWKDFCVRANIPVKFEAGNVVDYEELMNISDFCITTSKMEGFGMVFLEPWAAGVPVTGRDLPYITKELMEYGLEFPCLYNAIWVYSGNRKIDFKDLSHAKKEQAILGVLKNEPQRLRLLEDNPFLTRLFDDLPEIVIHNNQNIIKKRFSVEEYGKRLLEIYRAVSQ